MKQSVFYDIAYRSSRPESISLFLSSTAGNEIQILVNVRRQFSIFPERRTVSSCAHLFLSVSETLPFFFHLRILPSVALYIPAISTYYYQLRALGERFPMVQWTMYTRPTEP
jgi:hypothetical protein